MSTVALYVGTLEYGVAQGVFHLGEPVVDVASNLVALEDAYALHIIEANTSLSYPRELSLICSFARTATGCAVIGQGFGGASDAGIDRQGKEKGRRS